MKVTYPSPELTKTNSIRYALWLSDYGSLAKHVIYVRMRLCGKERNVCVYTFILHRGM